MAPSKAGPPRPGLDGTIYHFPSDTLLAVVTGRARGWSSAEKFGRIHAWHHIIGYVGNGRAVYGPVQWTDVTDLNFIGVGPPWSDSVELVKNPEGTVAILEFDALYGNQPVLYGVASGTAFSRWQLFNGNIRGISENELNAYPMVAILT